MSRITIYDTTLRDGSQTEGVSFTVNDKLKIAEKLEAKDSADIGAALNQVIKSAKSPQVLEKARKRMEQLKLTIQ